MCCFRQDAIRYLIYSSPTIIIQLCDDISLFMNLGVKMHRCPFYFHGRLVLIWGKDVYFISFRCVQVSLFNSIFHFQHNLILQYSSACYFPTQRHYQVWSPAGGWWPTPVAWKRNTAICAFSICILSSMVFKVSAEKERRPIAPYKHIPSQRWCKHAKEDDPSLP